jgi:TRAP-type C4-dicarboxylate transport system permease small subunit
MSAGCGSRPVAGPQQQQIRHDPTPPDRRMTAMLRRFSEMIAAAFIAAIFIAFIIQIVFRYAFNLPVGWTTEVSVIAWLWLVLWGAAFVLRDDEEIRFDLLTALVGRRTRIAMGIVGAVGVIALFGMALPATYAYVSFMKVESTSYLKIRFDWLFSIYLLFAVAVIARYLWKLLQLLRGRDPADSEAVSGGSAL